MCPNLAACHRINIWHLFCLAQPVPARRSTFEGVNNTRVIQCEEHVISAFVLTDILLLSSYCFGVYLFSREETEYLSNLASKVREGSVKRHSLGFLDNGLDRFWEVVICMAYVAVLGKSKLLYVRVHWLLCPVWMSNLLSCMFRSNY